MRFVSIGDLVIDFYYQDGKLLGAQGGMSSHNIIANLASFGFETVVLGVCGNDTAGDIAIQSLKDLGVSTNLIVRKDVITRRFHISYQKQNGMVVCFSKKKCPICAKKHWYETSLIDPQVIIPAFQDDDILVFDQLNEKNQVIIDQTKQEKMLDLGQYYEFEQYDRSQISNKIKNRFCFINLNERVEQYFMNRFSFSSLVELYHFLSPKLLIVTRGKRGADFVMDGQVYHYPLLSYATVVDETGAGDAFFAMYVGGYIKNDRKLTESFLSETFFHATNLTKLVVSKVGARGHLSSLFKIKKSGECCCETFSINSRKTTQWYVNNVNHLFQKLLEVIESSAYWRLKKFPFDANSSYWFVGTGGSYAAAYFASRVIHCLFGCITQACFPRELVYQSIHRIDGVFLFSYSGTSSDLLEVTKDIDGTRKIMITKGEHTKVSVRSGIDEQNIMSYRTNTNRGREIGFLSIEGVLAPASLFLRLYLEETDEVSLAVEDFIKESMQYWKAYFTGYFEEHKTMLRNILQIGIIFNLFHGDYTNTAAYDLESKMIESGTFYVTMHEKKNFSHGRFINYEHLSGHANLYLKQKDTTGYERKLLQYLEGGQTILIESRYNGILAEYDLLIASQYFMYAVANFLDMDISKPAYSENSMKIYFYKGSL